MRKTRFAVIITFFVLSVAMSARADTMWTLGGVTFTDGGVATGSFTLDPLGNVTAFDITTTPGTSQVSGVSFPGWHYTTTSPGTGSVGFYSISTGSGLGGNGACFPISCIAIGVPFQNPAIPVAPALTLYIDLPALPTVVSGGTAVVENICGTVSNGVTTVACSGGFLSGEFTGLGGGVTRYVDPGTLTGTFVPPTGGTSVPEPGTLPLLATGLAALAAFVMQKKALVG